MSVVPLQPARLSIPPGVGGRSNRRWIISAAIDQLLILSTPLLAIPAVYFLHSPMGIRAETISLIVASFFALGHHLPGMLRAYGDRELFDRFRWRFILAPALLFAAYFPLSRNHPDFIPLVVVFWATWHGLMQLYGFVRIYDSRVGSVGRVTAWLDWLVCLSGFVTAQLFCPQRVTKLLGHWYGLGGVFMSSGIIQTARLISLTLTIAILVAFCIHYCLQTLKGPKPNPIKLLLLVSGIGTWWFAVVYIENVILGAALFDICHDVQYLAIVWIYNCRRVSSNPTIGKFMTYVFRRGMVLLYLGMITAYGAIGMIPSLVENGTVTALVSGLIGTSTLLHYYYDGFIWKVREASTQAGLGLGNSTEMKIGRQMAVSGAAHLLKWSPLIVVTGGLLVGDVVAPSLAQSRKDELTHQFTETLIGTTAYPRQLQEQEWLLSEFERVQNLAQTVADDRNSGLRAAIMLANFGRNDEAVTAIDELLKEYPKFAKASLSLGEIHFYRGNLDQAAICFQNAVEFAETDLDRSMGFLKLGQLHLARGETELAKAKFLEAMKCDPDLAEEVKALQK